ncbi:hypothetical protein Micbo1qcDRAFT_164829 [Microdochium bolleyi]|uniref:Uncharacterized protein n=1 Tax=Microdochium bolleyi TaxID=196109 RepID=A0A136IZR2_9PEZI|nr:hypothetical protein Micbo1qcDRAFT_164829 [Microdochium bolleyi]
MDQLLLAPYNDSMMLGQGYNSFLQVSCIDRAIELDHSWFRRVATAAGTAGGPSQVVTCSSRLVGKASEIVRSMNISPASCIRAGAIEVPGALLSWDETKFASSDANAMISVKVVKEITSIPEDSKFIPYQEKKSMSSKDFFEVYGDCYISGFVEGGELLGLLSMKVLDPARKSAVRSMLESALGGSNSDSTKSIGLASTTLQAAAEESETTVTANWCGGGQIKLNDEEWTVERLFRSGEAFPGRIAERPQRTWAVLTPYCRNPSFAKYATTNSIVVPDFGKVHDYAHGLLDDYMGFKQNAARVQDALANPGSFQVSEASNAVEVNVQSLLQERKTIKSEMNKIIEIIDQLYVG